MEIQSFYHYFSASSGAADYIGGKLQRRGGGGPEHSIGEHERAIDFSPYLEDARRRRIITVRHHQRRGGR
uniref:Uncharacterized protein n=1 Tax=Leptobrachium leishanense TaxID=445787 RepID=A0A8C5R4N5_9ANUR